MVELIYGYFEHVRTDGFNTCTEHYFSSYLYIKFNLSFYALKFHANIYIFIDGCFLLDN